MDLYAATADSVNLVFARLILDAGLQETVDMAHAMGVTSELPPVCALATGSVGITPLDQAVRLPDDRERRRALRAVRRRLDQPRVTSSCTRTAPTASGCSAGPSRP